MLARKKSKHIKNIFCLVTDKITQRDLKVCHKGTDEMWFDLNTKPLQDKKDGIMQNEVMEVLVNYDNDVKHRCTHPLLMLKIETNKIPLVDGEVLERLTIVKRVATYTQKQEAKLCEAKGIDKVLILHQANKLPME